ncbi:PH domain-containing protein [Chloroflexota bacterium]
MTPWAILASVSFFIDQITFIGLPLILAVVFILPRYVSWRKTAYILTDEYLVVVQGAFTKSQRFDLPISQISDIQVRPGFFGRSLGYASVLLTIKDRGVIGLSYTPERSALVEHIQARIDISSLPEGESEA